MGFPYLIWDRSGPHLGAFRSSLWTPNRTGNEDREVFESMLGSRKQFLHARKNLRHLHETPSSMCEENEYRKAQS